MAVKRKPRKMQPYSREWERKANALARDYVAIDPCRDCGGPVLRRYCCTRCGSVDP